MMRVRDTHEAVTGDTGPILAEYVTEETLATELRKTRKTLRTWRALGQGPAVTMIGKDVYYRRADIRAWLLSQRREVA
jgi:hypothetical protein